MPVAGRVRGDRPVDELQQGAEVLALVRQRRGGQGLPVRRRDGPGHRVLGDLSEVVGDPVCGGSQFVTEHLRVHPEWPAAATGVRLGNRQARRAGGLRRCGHRTVAPLLSNSGRTAMIQNDLRPCR